MDNAVPRWLKILTVFYGVAALGAGVLKLIGFDPGWEHFQGWGLPYWFMILVGTFEVAGGLLLLLPRTASIGAFILSTIALGGVWTHAVHLEFLGLIPSGMAVLLTLTIFWKRKDETLALIEYPKVQ